MRKLEWKKWMSVVLVCVVFLCHTKTELLANTWGELKDNRLLSHTLKRDAKSDGHYTTENSADILDVLAAEGVALGQEMPPCIDLSETIYFPEVKLQKAGSCAAFATTYYQYTYEANRAAGITTRQDAKWYSPYFVYSYLNRGTTGGIQNYDAYAFIRDHGCLTWDEYYYGEESEETDAYWKGYSKDIVAMRNALGMRIDHFYEYFEKYSSGEVYSVEDKLKIAKTLLSNNIILSSYLSMGVIDTMENDDGEEVVYRMGAGYSRYHSVAIVGYDDYFTADVNGNGSIEDAERGAFKVANSWGTSWHKGGYFWVLYDAVVNETSAIPTAEESVALPEERLYCAMEDGVQTYYVIWQVKKE